MVIKVGVGGIAGSCETVRGLHLFHILLQVIIFHQYESYYIRY